MRDTLSIIAIMVSMAGSLEEAIKLVEEEVDKGDCMPISKELRDKRIKEQWLDKANSRKHFVLDEVVKEILGRNGTLLEALHLAKDREEKGSFEPFSNGDMRNQVVIRSWVDAVKYRNTFFFRELIDQVVEVATSFEEAGRLVKKAMAVPISEEEVELRIKSAWQKREEIEKSLHGALNLGK